MIQEQPRTTHGGATRSVGIVGVGFISEAMHIPTIQAFPGLSMRMLVDPFADERRMRELSERVGCQWSRNVNDMCVDLAVIATPISKHCEIGMTLLDKGSHLLVEKPLGATHAECMALLQAAAAKGRRVYCGQMRRFYKNVGIAKAAVTAGLIGELESVSIFEGNLAISMRKFYDPNRQSINPIDEGVFFDVGTHSIDSVVYVLEDLGGTFAMEDCVTDDLRLQSNVEIRGRIRLANGRDAAFQGAFSSSTGLANCIWFRGTRATLLLSVIPTVMPIIFPAGGGRPITLDSSGYSGDSPFVQQYRAILAGLDDGQDTVIDARRMLETVKVLDSAWSLARVGACRWMD